MARRYAFWLVGGLLLAVAVGAVKVAIDIVMRWTPDEATTGTHA